MEDRGDPVPDDDYAHYDPLEDLNRYKKEAKRLDAKMYAGMGQSPPARWYAKDWYELLQPLLADGICLDLILDGRQRHMIDETDFANDKWFCEWIYWVDFENETFDASVTDEEHGGTEIEGGKLRRWTFEELKTGYWHDLAQKEQKRRDGFEEADREKLKWEGPWTEEMKKEYDEWRKRPKPPTEFDLMFGKYQG